MTFDQPSILAILQGSLCTKLRSLSIAFNTSISHRVSVLVIQDWLKSLSLSHLESELRVG